MYYHLLEADDKGRAPGDPLFNPVPKSALQIIAKSEEKVTTEIPFLEKTFFCTLINTFSLEVFPADTKLVRVSGNG